MPISTLDYQTHTSRSVLQVTEDTIPWMPDIPSPRLTDPDTFFFHPPPDPVSQRDRRSALLVYDESLSRTNQFTTPRTPVRPSYTANSTFYQQPYTNPQRDRRLVHQTYELPRFETPPPSASEPESPSWPTYILSIFLVSLLVTTTLGGRRLLYLAYWALEKSKRKWDDALNGTLYLLKSLRFMRGTTQKVALAGMSLASWMKMKMNIDGARMQDVGAWASRLRLMVAGAQLDIAKVWLYRNVRYEMLSRVFWSDALGGSWRGGNGILGGN